MRVLSTAFCIGDIVGVANCFGAVGRDEIVADVPNLPMGNGLEDLIL